MDDTKVFVGKMVDMVKCNWSHYQNVFKKCIALFCRDRFNKAKYFRDLNLLITASSEDLPSCFG